MKFRKIAIMLLLLSLWGGSMIFADAASQKVRVMINGIEQDEGGVLLDGKTYLPLRQLAEAMGAVIRWDDNNKRAVIYKPNVHMFLYKGNTPFGVVDKGYQGKIKVFSQIDNLKTDISGVKVTISDPYGKERFIQSESVTNNSDTFWFVTDEFDYKFDASGKYTVRFYLRLAGSDEWVPVSEKLITSRNA
ncbi:stalk domain-containing protein [Paenibacillus sp. LHD-117]|uniref:stalk domain-containing protein n=1 Tax=Paenibacillus sp. LHD-117 TaxID=3071412 RepID=UPI0027E09F6B|nr:stalk domain-containing protein [Paenibacillus sp. LHD-117]MDQ6420886.1 stalk domain-containing protein [Paenibacillus sp. LHD-117]